MELRLFGFGTFVVDGVDVLGPGKPLFLLGYLASQPDRMAERGRLIDTLWCDVPPARGRVTLRQTLLQLKRRIGDDAVAAVDDTIVLSSRITVDRDQFLRDVGARKWSSAAAQGVRPFLDRAAAPGAERFERWVEGERDRLRDLVETAMVLNVRTAIGSGDAAAAAELVSEWHRADPLHEPAGRLLVATLLDMGLSTRAHIEAQAILADMQAAGVEPSGSTVALLDRARAVPSDLDKPGNRHFLEPDLVGREPQYAALIKAEHDARRGQPRVVAIVAAAGLGKTRLAQVFAQRRSMRESVIVVRAARAAADVPGAALREFVGSVAQLRGAIGVSQSTAGILVGVNPRVAQIFEAASAASAQPQAVLIGAVQELLQVVAEGRMVAIVLDDLHWWDRFSRQIVFGAIALRPEGGLLVIGASRRPIPEFGADEVLNLAPLTEDQVESLVRSIAACECVPIDRVVQVITHASGGVPQFALESIRALLDQGVMGIDSEGWVLRDSGRLFDEASSVSVLEGRLGRLSAEARRTLELLAVAESPVERAACEPVDTELEGSGFVQYEGNFLMVAHESIGERLLAGLCDEVRRQREGELAARLIAVSALEQSSLRLAGRLALRAESADVAASAFTRWRKERRPGGNPLRGWARFLAVDDAAVARVLAEMPIWNKLSRQAYLWAGACTVAIALLVYTVWPGRPATSLSVLGMSQFLNVDAGVAMKSITVEAQTASGAPAYLGGLVTARIHDGDAVLGGDTAVHEEGNRFAFTHLQVIRGCGQLWFVHAGLDSAPGPHLQAGDCTGRITILEGRIAGQAFRGPRPAISVRPGQALDGFVALKVLTLWPTASVILGEVGLWEPREHQWRTISALVPQSDSVFRDLRLRDTLRRPEFLRAPDKPGRYQLLLVAAAERSVEGIASGTNWTVDRVRWHDGDDIADWPQSTVDSLSRYGRVSVSILIRNDVRRQDSRIGAVIDILVQ